MASVSFANRAALWVVGCVVASATASGSNGADPPVVCVPDATKVTEKTDIDAACSKFCAGDCAFLNVSAGDTGKPETITLYRVTPWNITGITNKNTGDPAGDITFYFTNKMKSSYSRPSSHHDFLAGPNIVGQFKVQVDGQWAPYKQCNPIGSIADPAKPDGNFVCEHNCMSPPNCPAKSYENGVAQFGGMYCGCRRGNTTVGRVDMANAFGGHGGHGFRRLQAAPMPSGGGGGAGLADYWKCSAVVQELCSQGWPPAPADKCEVCADRHQQDMMKAGCTDDFVKHACAADFKSCQGAVLRLCSKAAGGCATCAAAHRRAPPPSPSPGAACLGLTRGVLARGSAELMAANCTSSYLDYACMSGGGGHHHGGGPTMVAIGGYWCAPTHPCGQQANTLPTAWGCVRRGGGGVIMGEGGVSYGVRRAAPAAAMASLRACAWLPAGCATCWKRPLA
jgi:hypothetical protein